MIGFLSSLIHFHLLLYKNGSLLANGFEMFGSTVSDDIIGDKILKASVSLAWTTFLKFVAFKLDQFV